MHSVPVLTPATISVSEMASNQRPAADAEMAAAVVTAAAAAVEAAVAAAMAAAAVKIPFYLKAKLLLSLQMQTPAVAATT